MVPIAVPANDGTNRGTGDGAGAGAVTVACADLHPGGRAPAPRGDQPGGQGVSSQPVAKQEGQQRRISRRMGRFEGF
jgi:hypothetical protein